MPEHQDGELVIPQHPPRMIDRLERHKRHAYSSKKKYIQLEKLNVDHTYASRPTAKPPTKSTRQANWEYEHLFRTHAQRRSAFVLCTGQKCTHARPARACMRTYFMFAREQGTLML